jgi:ubiquilin
VPGASPPADGAAPVQPPAAGAQPDFAAMMQQMMAMQMPGGGAGGNAGAGGAAGANWFNGGVPAAPVGNPALIYRNELNQLSAMGFSDLEANLASLVATGGNVEAAVERLLR